jgi:hypothetical protein
MFVRIRHHWPLKFVGSPNQLSKVLEFWDLAALAIFWSLSLEFSTVAKFRPFLLTIFFDGKHFKIMLITIFRLFGSLSK